MQQSNSPQVSFVVPVHNRLDCTKAFLRSLLDTVQETTFELIFVNDCSQDGTREFLDSLLDARIRVLHNESRLSYAKSTNRGVAQARGKILALLNNDLVLTPGWLKPMLDGLDEFEHVGAVGNIQRNVETQALDHAGIIFDLVGLPDHFGKNYPFILPFKYREFPAVTGACMIIDKTLFNDLEGFDEAFMNGCEDVDLCLRLGKRGYRNIVAGKSFVWHHVSASPGRRDKDRLNNRRLLERWGDELQFHGRRDWPIQYLMRYRKQPWLFNGPKLLDALARLMRLKSGDSKWAIEKRNGILNFEP